MLIKVPSSVSKHRIDRMVHYFEGFLESPAPLSVLDVGCGHGYITKALQDAFPSYAFKGADVVVRPDSAVPVVPYDGKKLPFDSGSFDVVMAVDMLHHTDDPVAVLGECARVAGCFVLLKDHKCDSFYDKWRLTFLDWFGNRPFGIPMTYNFLSSTQWHNAYRVLGLKCIKEVGRLEICPRPFYYPFDHDLHFIAKLAVAGKDATVAPA